MAVADDAIAGPVRGFVPSPRSVSAGRHAAGFGYTGR